MKQQPRIRSAALPIVVLTALAMVLTGAFQAPMPTARAAVDAADADYSGYATSTPVHVDAIETSDTRVVDVEEAMSGAAVASKGLGTIHNEMDRNVVTPNGKSAARGTALEVGVVHAPDAANQIILKGVAEASAPSATEEASQELGPVSLPPVAYASLLKSTAKAKWNENTCVLGGEISKGYAYAADAQLVGQGAGDGTLTDPVVAADIGDERATDSVSTTRLAPNDAGAFGLVSETRQVVAPVSLLGGAITIKVAGTWVLRAFAGGTSGSHSIHYGPENLSPETKVLTVQAGPATLASVTLQQLLGTDGLHIPVNLPGVANLDIAIGEPPRAIGGAYGSDPVENGDGTESAAAVDVARVTLEVLDGISVEDIRVGHMETAAKVPSGGINCPIPVTKTPDPASVGTGGTFKTTIDIKNPFDCDLNNVTATDDISGVPFTIGEVSDGGTKTSNSVSWNLGTIPAGQSKSVTVTITAGRQQGQITDTVTVKGDCGVGSVDGSTTVTVGLTGTAGLTVGVGAGTAVLGLQLPRTGGPTMLYVAGAILALLAGAFVARKGLGLIRENE